MSVQSDPVDAAALAAEPVAGRSLWQDAWIRLRRNRAAVASMVVLVVLALVGIFGPALWPHPYDRVFRSSSACRRASRPIRAPTPSFPTFEAL